MSDAIAVVAESLLEGVAFPPTDLDALANKLGIASIKKETMPISGELRRTNLGFEVVYSADLPLSRRRFTIAHEAAHAYFEKDGKHRNTHELERLCDMLATEFLMPRSSMQAYKSSDLSPARILELSRKFSVSLRTAAIRCYELFNTTIFEVADERITWGCGIVREGPVAQIQHGDIRSVAREASRGGIGERLLFIEKDGVPRRHLISYAPLSAQQNTALLLIKRAPAA
jgi:hypothetical protein